MVKAPRNAPASARKRRESVVGLSDLRVVRREVDSYGMRYTVLRSEDAGLYVGMCELYRSLSWQAESEAEALAGIQRLVNERAL